MNTFRTLVGAGVGMLLLAATVASAASVDLGTWTEESYPAVSGFGAGVWTVAPGGGSVTQSVNGQPTLFFSPFDAQGTDVRGTIRVAPDGDDDFIGFALGFNAGDSSNAAADYLLVDWKQGTQYFNFAEPAGTPGTTAYAGLAVSRVTGVPNADEFWGHTDLAGDTGGGLTELARGANLGSTGYSDNVDYDFRFIFQPTSLQVYVDDALELNVAGSFSDGAMAFYNFSQSSVTYSAFTLDPAPNPTTVPGPASLLLVGIGAAGVIARQRRRHG